MTDSDPEIVVVGAGVMGSATARALASAGHEVLVLERFELGHRRGSSHGASRIFRLSYPDPSYVRDAQEALTLWRDLEAEAGEELVRTTGGLDLGPGAERHAVALEACGAPFEWLERAEVGRRFPGVAAPGPAVFQGDAGIALADRALGAFVRGARARGAEVRDRTPVTAIRVEGDRAVVGTQDRDYRPRVAVVTAGAWARGLLAGAGVDLPVRPTRETVVYFRAETEVPSVVEWGDPAAYGLVAPGVGVKAGEHHAGPGVDPDEDGPPDERSVAVLSAWVRERFPAADPDPHHAETCLYTNTADESFILERRGPIVIGSPCSGHGFKFAPLTGRRLAALAGGVPVADPR